MNLSRARTATLLLATLAGAAMAASAAGEVPAVSPPAVAAAHRREAGRRRRSPIEDRVRALARNLHLDAAQEAEVRRVLLARAAQMQLLLRRPPDPNTPRPAAIQAINERTAERIRAKLNDEQKKLYLQRVQPPPAEGQRSVEEWMHAQQPKPK